MCITKSLCCAAKINTTLLINYTSIKFTKKKKKTLTFQVAQFPGAFLTSHFQSSPFPSLFG